MSVNNNVWNRWSSDINTGISFVNGISQQASSVANQINNLGSQLQNHTITLPQYDTEIEPIIQAMNEYTNELSNQYSGISANNPAFTAILTNLNAAWAQTVQSLAPGVTNPNITNDPSQPTIPINYNSDGSASVTFTCCYNHDGEGCYLTNPDGSRINSLPWLPQESTVNNGTNLTFGLFLQNCDYQQGTPMTFYLDNSNDGTPAETITCVANPGSGTMTITVTMGAGNLGPFGARVSPNTNALTNFVNSL